MYKFLNAKVLAFVRITRGRRKKRKKTNNIVCVKARFALEVLGGGGQCVTLGMPFHSDSFRLENT